MSAAEDTYSTVQTELEAAEARREQYERERRTYYARLFTAARKRRRKITEASRKANRS